MGIEFLVMDVDGTLTDGKIYIGDNGEQFKSFNIKDGCGIHDLLPKYNIIPVVITARQSKIVKNRCDELDVKYLFQCVKDKDAQLKSFIFDYNLTNNTNFNLSNVAYIGDDLADLICMNEVLRSKGVVGCPADACEEVNKISTFICSKNGGDGAVREFIEFIIKMKQYKQR